MFLGSVAEGWKHLEDGCSSIEAVTARVRMEDAYELTSRAARMYRCIKLVYTGITG
jgi:hypothetical protein